MPNSKWNVNMSDKKKFLVVPPFSLHFIPAENDVEQSSINDLRISNPIWYQRHKRLEALSDDLLGRPQNLQPTTDKWKGFGIPASSSNLFASHTPFSSIPLESDRRRKNPDTNKYVLSANTRYGLEEVYHRYYGAKKEMNPFMSQKTTREAVKDKIVIQETLDRFNTQTKQRLREFKEKSFKTTAPFPCHTENRLVTQLGYATAELVGQGDADASSARKYGSKETAVVEFGKEEEDEEIIEGGASSAVALSSRVVPEMSSKQDRLTQTPRAFASACLWEMEDRRLVKDKRAASQNAYLSEKDALQIQTENADRIDGVLEKEEESLGKVTDVTQDDTMAIGIRTSPLLRQMLVSRSDYTRCVLGREEENVTVESAPLYHPLVWKAQLQHDHHDLYRDPVPKGESEERMFEGIANLNRLFGDYRALEIDPNSAQKRKKIGAN